MLFDIPFYSMSKEEQSSFIIRPILQEVSPALLNEQPHRHTYHEILWIRSGHGEHSIDDEFLPITPNTLYWIKQGQIHDFKKGINLDGFLIRFTTHFLPYDPLTSISTSLISQFKNLNAISLDESEVPPFERIILSLYEEYTSPIKNSAHTGILQHLLMALLIMLERKSHHLSISDLELIENPDKHVFRRFLFLLEEHFRQQHQISFYATQLGVGNRKLSLISKQYAGLTAKQLILQCLMREAKRSLTFTQQTLTEITYRLGFEDTAYFCRLFKKQTGKTPQQYKKETKQQLDGIA